MEKDHEPQDIKLYQEEWEKLLDLLDKAIKKKDKYSGLAKALKYRIQCGVNTAILHKKWI